MSAVVRFHEVVPPPPREGWPDQVSFEVEEGAFVLFATTPAVALGLLRLVAGLREPADGRVEVLGVRPGRLNRWESQAFRRRLGVGFEEPSGLVSNLTLRMNLVVPMLYSGLADMGQAHQRATEIIDRFSLHRWADRRPADVPPEIRREAVAARAAVRDPDLIILEEPIAGLRRDRASRLLTVCRERARTVIVTTAEREGIQFEFADTVIALDDTGIEVRTHEVGVV